MSLTKETSSASILIDSRSRTSGTSTNFEINLVEAISNVTKISLISCAIPYTPFNIVTGVNDTITFFENSLTKTSTLTAGSYSAASLATAVATAITTTSGGFNTYTGSYSSSTGRFTFTAGNAFRFLCSSSKFPYTELGYAATDTGSATSQTSTNIVSLERPTYFYIDVDKFAQTLVSVPGNPGSTTNPPIKFSGTFCVPVGPVFFGDLIYFYPDNSIVVEVDYPLSIDVLRIKLYNSRGAILDLNGADWHMHVIVEYLIGTKRKIKDL